MPGDSFELRTTGPSGLAFTGASIATGSTPYVFLDSAVGSGLPFSAHTFPTTDFTAADIAVPSGSYPEYTTIDPGQVDALGLVSDTIGASATGTTYAIGFGPGTGLTDPNGQAIPFTTAPEPSAWVLALIATAMVPAYRRSRRPDGEVGRP